jgi:hypothetical protein
MGNKKTPARPRLHFFYAALPPALLPSIKGKPETGKVAADIFIQVPGDGRQGISHSGVSCSAIGSRLQAPAADGREADT